MFDDMRFDGLSLLRQISLSDSSSSSISSSTSSSRSGGIPSYGAQTPVLDGLIRGGVAMTSAHTMGATEPAVCAPSRAMLLTGKPLWDSHCCSEGCICPGPRNALALDGGATFVKHLRDASEHRYVTHFVGKWHNTQASLMDPLSGFSSASAVAFGGMWPHNEVARAAKDWSGGARQKLTPHRGRSSFSTDLFADAAVDFLRGQQQQQQQQQPFCLMVSFTAPHDPRTPPPQWRYTGRLGAYRGRAGPAKESVRAWDAEGEGGRGGGGRGGGGGGGGRGDLVPVPNIFEDSAAWTWDWLRATGEATMRDEGLLPPPHWKLEDKLRAMRKEGQASLSRRGKGLAAARTIRGLAEEWRQYYGLVEQLDDAIGRILRALPRPRSTAAAPAAAAAAAADDDEEVVEAWRENTLVVVTSDHGLGLGAHGWLGKQNLYEHSTKVPLILSGARVHRAPDDRRQRQQRQGWRRDTAVYLHDVGPSLLELLLVAPLPPPRTTTTAATTTTATASAGESSPFTARSFAALVKAPRGSFDAARQYEGRRFIFMAYREIIRAVIDVSTNMKLVEHYDGLQEKNKGAARHTALFNLTSDPFELQNLLVGGEATARRSKAMATQLGKAMATQEHVLRRRVNRGRGT
jgi:arylsulfatase A-like enzyme